jgi:hypothetical protein
MPPELSMIERRRLEYLGEDRPSVRRYSRTTRGFATTLLAMSGIAPALGLLLSFNAAPHPLRLAASAASEIRGATPHRVVERDVAVALTPQLESRSSDRDAQAQDTPAAQSQQPFRLKAQPWRLTADGTWVAVVQAAYQNEDGSQQDRPHAFVTFSASDGEILELDPLAHHNPAILVTLAHSAQVTISAASESPDLGDASITLPAPPADAASFAAVAASVGPHLNSVGWTPLPDDAGVSAYHVYRSTNGGPKVLVTTAPAGTSFWRDTTVTPDVAYDYSVVAQIGGDDISALTETVQTPGEMPRTSLESLAGKGMFLFFSADAGDKNNYQQFDPDDVVALAVKAGVGEIELRMSRGTFFEATTPDARAWLDRLIDKSASAGIRLVAWTVPRRATSEDVAKSIAQARYVTASGNGFAGLALDLEPGDRYMGHGALAADRIAAYMELARKAVGPDYLVVATVMSPRLTHWTNEDYPYSRIARFATAMQPMEYWHHYRDGAHEYAQSDVAGDCSDVVGLVQSLAGRHVPVNVAGQSTDLGRTGTPSADEVGWCLSAAKSAGAIGETFFDWQGTTRDQWAAIEAYRW